MRPRADNDYLYPTYLGIGTLHGLTPAGDEEVAGKLILPDPEQRHGWREFYVKRPSSGKPGARPIGFRPLNGGK